MKLNIKQLKKVYHDQEVLKSIDLSCENVGVLALIGASGSGKSTLLRLIAGLEPFESGEIFVNDQKIVESEATEYRKRVGFVFQDHNLFSHLSIMENIYLVLEQVHMKKRSEVKDRVERLLEQFGLLEHAHKLPHQISGGQSQRASIVRALAIEPDLILLDEPTSSLDPVLTFEVLEAIKTLAEKHIDFIIVTHEIGFAKNVSDQIIFMENGSIIEQGGPEILNRPSAPALKSFLNKVLTFEAAAVDKE